MRLALLNTNENIELIRELNRDYIKDTYGTYMQAMIFDIACELGMDTNQIHDSDLYKEFCASSVKIINKILLDNVLRYIQTNNISTFVNLLNNNLLSHDIHVNIFYSAQMVEIFKKYINATEEEHNSIAYIINNYLYIIINNIYGANKENYNNILLRLLDSIHTCLGSIQIKYFKVELDTYNRPMLFYTEKENNEIFYHQ